MKKNIGEKNLNCKNHILKNTSGITLIALVITIIVLLILARGFTKYGIKSKWNI